VLSNQIRNNQYGKKVEIRLICLSIYYDLSVFNTRFETKSSFFFQNILVRGYVLDFIFNYVLYYFFFLSIFNRPEVKMFGSNVFMMKYIMCDRVHHDVPMLINLNA